jgi:toxin YhaV
MYVENGWQIRFHRVFAERYRELLANVRRLRDRLPPDQYAHHPDVKLLASLDRVIRKIIPADPEAREFWLKGNLSKFRRTKGSGLPDRYRLFWVFSARLRVIIILYLNDSDTLRKEGSSRDPYAVFQRLLGQGTVGADFEANWTMVQTELERQKKDTH